MHKLFLLNIFSDSSSISDTPFDRDGFIAKLFPNGIYDFVIQIIAFVILILIMFFFAYKPVKAYMKKRHDYIDNELRSAEAANKVALEAANKKDDIINEGKTEASQIVSNAKIQAEKMKEDAINESNQISTRRRKEADEDIALAKEKSIKEAKKEIVDLTILASSKLLERNLNEEDDKKFVSSFVKEIQDDKK